MYSFFMMQFENLSVNQHPRIFSMMRIEEPQVADLPCILCTTVHSLSVRSYRDLDHFWSVADLSTFMWPYISPSKGPLLY